MQRSKLTGLLLLAALIATSLPVAAETELRKDVVAAGGGRCVNADHKLVSTVGQVCVGVTASADTRHLIGFLASAGVFVSGAGEDGPPVRAFLAQNAPNPFSPSTTIRFDLPDARRARLEVFSPDGRRIVTLVDEALPPGRLAVVWDSKDAGGRPVASGLYLYRLTAGDYVATHRMVLTR